MLTFRILISHLYKFGYYFTKEISARNIFHANIYMCLEVYWIKNIKGASSEIKGNFLWNLQMVTFPTNTSISPKVKKNGNVYFILQEI